ncbi:MAG TPA: divalent metal cation transporter [Rudaea sp.]|jgi:NRAMP (natural resistance-associated macrophage protein)-like metal ion transporter|nr:divalent metal cation transporter [Rudaea sp.]
MKRGSSHAKASSGLRHRMGARLRNPSIWECLGPGLITGAADDDPSGIATYSQTGARFGFATLWTLWLTYPLMVAMQYVSALIGRVTGEGLAANIRKHYPKPVLYGIVLLLFIANTINLGADLGAMGESMTLILGGEPFVWTVIIAIIALTLLIVLKFRSYARILKYLTLSLFAYAGVLFLIHVPWAEVLTSLVMPKAELSRDYLTAIVAIFGTTISPYLFFWQASHEVEQQRGARDEQPLQKAPSQGRVQLRRVKWDTLIGMAISNLVAFCIMLTAATVLHAHGKTQIDSAAEAAQALKPIAGDLSFFLFAAGIVGTGMLAIPTLAGSAAYAVAETFRWPKGLDKHLFQASGFYGTVALGTILGVVFTAIAVNPMKALFWSAVLNGVIAIPLMVIIMLLSSKKSLMKTFVASPRVRIAGWAATVIMFAAFVGMIATM